jgi:hypothetical protein
VNNGDQVDLVRLTTEARSLQYIRFHYSSLVCIYCCSSQASEELEDRESLAQIAATGEDSLVCDGETYIG